MFSRLQWLLLQLSRRLWVRATAFSVLGVVTALIALLVEQYIPDEIPAKIGADAVDSLLQIIATSMLSVMIFSLSTIVSAYASATSNTTPRATQLLISDSTAQNALATFLGAFLFSLVGIIVLQTGLYGDNGRVILYAVTLGVIVIIVLTLLRWTDYVLRLGRVGPTCDRVETVATNALRRRRASPYLGGQPREAGEAGYPEGAISIHTDSFGYVEHIDMQGLQNAAKEAEIDIYLIALPGHFAGAAQPLVRVMRLPEESCLNAIRNAFSISAARSFDQDPRFGVCVLSEIASRALSPAINDPGTAIDILSRGARLLALWSSNHPDAVEVDDQTIRYPNVHVPPVELEELFDDFFIPIARDGAGLVEVGIHLQKMLQTLACLGDTRYRKAAARHSAQALARAEAVLSLTDDLVRVQQSAARVAKAAET
ncbi:MAG TPA: DUF2254 domain-containing protein [Dokdonella sp.]|uniref:DUF2254 domain-containing protein n=1 Tax=Dokdonella sp. TaxID=2291710 RepID=UPI002D7E3830|nr:DUF2254 domain-containing protein [Dokdonella sp.]HET9032214.1 DUF2254 domain-containing protein [Dokdonella sp.]